jgi:hypothetical protein
MVGAIRLSGRLEGVTSDPCWGAIHDGCPSTTGLGTRQRKLEEPLRQTTRPGALPLDYDDPVFDR